MKMARGDIVVSRIDEAPPVEPGQLPVIGGARTKEMVSKQTGVDTLQLQDPWANKYCCVG